MTTKLTLKPCGQFSKTAFSNTNKHCVDWMGVTNRILKNQIDQTSMTM